MPYAENLGFSATVSMGMEIQDLVNYFESLTSILLPLKKENKAVAYSLGAFESIMLTYPLDITSLVIRITYLCCGSWLSCDR